MRELWDHLEETQRFYALVGYLRCQHTITPDPAGWVGTNRDTGQTQLFGNPGKLVCELVEGTDHDHLMLDDESMSVYCWKSDA